MGDEFTGPKLVFSRDRRFTSTAFEDIAPRSAGYIIKGIFPLRGLGFIVGASKAGKTFVAIDWFARVACGARKVMGHKCKQVGVVYVGAEDPEGIELRIHAWKLKNPRGSYTPFRLIKRGVNLLDEDEVDELVAEIRDIAAIYEENGHRLGVVVFDTFSRCLPGAEENNSESMSRAIGSLERLGRALDVLTVAVAHHGKDGTKGIRGWSGLDAASDATVTVERDEVNKGQRSITLSKVKNGKDGDVQGFTLAPVPCGLFDEDGDESWSMVVEYDHGPPPPTTGKRRTTLSPAAEIILSALHQLADEEMHRQPVPAGVEGVRAGTWAVRRADLSLTAATNGMANEQETPAAYRKRLQRGIEELIKAKRIRVFGDAIWAI